MKSISSLRPENVDNLITYKITHLVDLKCPIMVSEINRRNKKSKRKYDFVTISSLSIKFLLVIGVSTIKKIIIK